MKLSKKDFQIETFINNGTYGKTYIVKDKFDKKSN